MSEPLITILTAAFPFTGYFDEEPRAETSSQVTKSWQISDPTLVVPESTMNEKPERYVHDWDNNPVATIPESTMGEGSQRYIPNWDDNPVATIPESTMGVGSGHYIHNWDDNPVATIPESTMSSLQENH